MAYTVPGLKADSGERLAKLLQDRLNSLNDLTLTLKHVHWNVTGPNFIAIHTMLDPQVVAVRAMADETAERITALGGSPNGTPGASVRRPRRLRDICGEAAVCNPTKGGAIMAVGNDLADLKGVGPKYAEMLKSIGVDSIKELSHRNASHLKEMIEARHGAVVGLSEHECQTWINEAKAHA